MSLISPSATAQNVEYIAEIPYKYVQVVPAATRSGILADGTLYRYHFRMLSDGTMIYQFFTYTNNEDTKISEWRFDTILPARIIAYNDIKQIVFTKPDEVYLLVNGKELKENFPTRLVKIKRTGEKYEHEVIAEKKGACDKCNLTISPDGLPRIVQLIANADTSSLNVWKVNPTLGSFSLENACFFNMDSLLTEYSAGIEEKVGFNKLYVADNAGNIYFTSSNTIQKIDHKSGLIKTVADLPEPEVEESELAAIPLWEPLVTGVDAQNKLLVISKKVISIRGREKVIPILGKISVK